MKKTLLAVVAHPDDESYGIGGTLARYAAEGVEVHVAVATDGAAGSVDENWNGNRSRLAEAREEELKAAVKILRNRHGSGLPMTWQAGNTNGTAGWTCTNTACKTQNWCWRKTCYSCSRKRAKSPAPPASGKKKQQGAQGQDPSQTRLEFQPSPKPSTPATSWPQTPSQRSPSASANPRAASEEGREEGAPQEAQQQQIRLELQAQLKEISAGIKALEGQRENPMVAKEIESLESKAEVLKAQIRV